jgi:hypothetical protein
MTLRSPEGSGIKGGKTEYHAHRMLVALLLIDRTDLAPEFAERLAVYHARLAARAALNGMYNGKRPYAVRVPHD